MAPAIHKQCQQAREIILRVTLTGRELRLSENGRQRSLHGKTVLMYPSRRVLRNGFEELDMLITVKVLIHNNGRNDEITVLLDENDIKELAEKRAEENYTCLSSSAKDIKYEF
jgi:hypothetical protein